MEKVNGQCLREVFFVELENETFWFIDQEPDIDVDEPTGCRVDEVYVGCYVEVVFYLKQ